MPPITNISSGYEPTRQKFYLTWTQDGKTNYYYAPLRYMIEDKIKELKNKAAQPMTTTITNHLFSYQVNRKLDKLPETVSYAIQCFAFLIPNRETVTAAELADMIPAVYSEQEPRIAAMVEALRQLDSPEKE